MDSVNKKKDSLEKEKVTCNECGQVKPKPKFTKGHGPFLSAEDLKALNEPKA